MTRLPLVSLWMIAATAGAGIAVAAEERPPVLVPAAESSGPTATPASAKPRPISATAAAQLTAAAPKYTPAPAKPVETAEPAPDLRETDKPRNTIVRLPRFLVAEDKPPVLNERNIATPKARLELALKRHPGLRLGSFWIFRNDGIALAMLEEEERLERMKEMNDMLTLLPAAEQKQMKPVVDQTFLRHTEPR